jgi:hypothetical protein
MTWEYKMQEVLKDVLGELWSVEVISADSFKVLHEGVLYLVQSANNNLESHWREVISISIKTIYENKIKNALLKQ